MPGLAASLLALAALCGSGPATAQETPSAPPSRQACFDDHAASQELRLDGALIEARAKLRVCSDPNCPGVLRAECAEWLAQVEQAIPSVVFLVERDDNEVTDVRVSVDGKPLAEKLDGSAFELDPGAHRFKFELDGFEPLEQTVVLRQFEKRRAIRVEFRSPQPVAGGQTSTTPAPSAPAASPSPGRTSRPVPALTYVFGGLALAAAGAGAYLGLDAIAKHGDYEKTCSPNCSSKIRDELSRQLLLADILGGVAIASGTLSAVVFFTRPVVPDEPSAGAADSLRRAASPHRLGVTVTGTF